MWGAQARAAEYKAFQAAAARRASEEHKIPQNSAPVSLSVFTKNAPLNRNRGTKAWKPLVLEDTPEADNDSPEDNEGTFSTPTRLRQTDRCDSVSDGSDISLLTRNAQVTGSSESTPSSSVPTAPRAMLRIPQTLSTLVNPTPKRIQPHFIVQQAQQDIIHSVNTSPGNFTRTGGYPNPISYPRIAGWCDLQGLPVIVPAPMLMMPTLPVVESLTVGYPGNIMVPNDISPTKQENKLASLSHEFAGPSFGFFTPNNNFTPAAGSLANEMLAPMPSLHFGGNSSGGSHQGGLFVNNPALRPPLPHVNSDSVVEMDGSFSDSSSFGVPNIVRPYSYPEVAAAPVDEPTRIDRTIDAINPNPAPLPVIPVSNEEPYDRKTKMQSFVAAQQALARTGKTVLHNPNLHRVKASDTASPAHSGSTATSPEHNFDNQMFTPGSFTIVKPPPGFELQQRSFELQPPGFGLQPFPRQPSEADNDKKTSPIDQATLRQIFEVDKEDWFELKPVTKADRIKMIRVIRTFARAQAPDETREFAPRVDNHGKKELERWMHLANKDNKPITATRKLFEEAAKERLSSGANGLNGSELSQAEIECAAICAVGDIVANFTDDSGSAAAGTDADGLFRKYKPAPEYAIERGRLLLGNSGNASFFEENTGGFYTAPSRIARDPRFRPAGKEAAQGKVDENWKIRVEMYGRRRI